MLQLRTLIKASGELELSLARVPVPEPKGDEILVRIDAAPINPSDIGLLTGPADISQAKESGSGEETKVTAPIPAAAMERLTARLDQSMPAGNEGAGVVVKAGASAEAQALLGKTVSLLGGAMYAEFKCVKASDALVMPEGTTAKECASAFVNPLTALCFLETMRREGHHAIVHTAAASNLGQMLVKLCLKDNVPLVNIVRNAEQGQILRSLGAKYVLDSTSPTFKADLVNACAETKATLLFDAIGGGSMTDQVLSAMELALSRSAQSYSRYGSNVHKQAYIYGALDTSPTHLARSYGLAWGVGGWLLTPWLMKLGADAQKLRLRVAQEIKTTFSSSYETEVSLVDAVKLSTITGYSKKATGKKYLIVPSKQ